MLIISVVCLFTGWIICTDTQLVFDFVKSNANKTFQGAEGELKYPYLIPSGYYKQLWDWDSMLMGVALLDFGSGEYLEGSMMNFLSAVNLSDGRVKGCLTPKGASPTLYQAKPVLIQGAYISAKTSDSFTKWYFLKEQMESYLEYWSVGRLDITTQLPQWYDQMESGYSNPPPTCTLCLSSSDIVVFLWRELEAFRLFIQHWKELGIMGDEGIFSTSRIDELQENLKDSMMKVLFSEKDGFFMAYNTTTKEMIRHRVFLLGFPLWGGIDLESSVVSSVVEQLKSPDMFSEYGIRSTSSKDARYNNKKEIDPYSNWQGPIWINSNSLLAYGIAGHGYVDFAKEIASRIIRVLADDLRRNEKWHECYNSDTGEDLAAPGFLSWNTMSATLLSNIEKGVDPYELKF